MKTVKLTSAYLRKLVLEEVAKMAAVEDVKVPAETDAGDLADTLEAPKDHEKDMKLKSESLRRRKLACLAELRKINAAQKRLASR